MFKCGDRYLFTARIIDQDMVIPVSTEEKQNKNMRFALPEGMFRKFTLGFEILKLTLPVQL